LPERSAPPDVFGRAAREYEQGRPEWPAELIDRVVERLGLGSIAVLPDEERAAFAARRRELCPDGEYRGRLHTVAYWTRLEP
jgi:hypothetical protein